MDSGRASHGDECKILARATKIRRKAQIRAYMKKVYLK